MPTRRKPVPGDVRLAVLTESGFRCGVPACRGIFPIEIHHLVPVRDGGDNDPNNLLPLCPNCHAHHECGTITRSALDGYKSILVALNQAFDQESITMLNFLSGIRPPLYVWWWGAATGVSYQSRFCLRRVD